MQCARHLSWRCRFHYESRYENLNILFMVTKLCRPTSLFEMTPNECMIEFMTVHFNHLIVWKILLHFCLETFENKSEVVFVFYVQSNSTNGCFLSSKAERRKKQPRIFFMLISERVCIKNNKRTKTKEKEGQRKERRRK